MLVWMKRLAATALAVALMSGTAMVTGAHPCATTPQHQSQPDAADPAGGHGHHGVPQEAASDDAHGSDTDDCCCLGHSCCAGPVSLAGALGADHSVPFASTVPRPVTYTGILPLHAPYVLPFALAPPSSSV